MWPDHACRRRYSAADEPQADSLGCWSPQPRGCAYRTMSPDRGGKMRTCSGDARPACSPALAADTAEENIQARIRGNILMALCQQVRLRWC